MMSLNQTDLEVFFSFLIWWSIFILVLAIIFIVYKFILYFLKRFVNKINFSPNVVNGIRFMIRLIVILAIFGTFGSMSGFLIPGGIPVEIVVIIGAAVGTVFALSATTVIQNFVAGIYIILTRPFNVGDLVRINTYEGIVDEVSLNHTKLRLRSGGHFFISNQSIITSKITNFSIPILEHEGINKQAKKFKEELVRREITRYSFTLEIPKDNPERTKQVFEEVTELFKDVFSRPIRFITTAYLHKVIVSVVLVSEDPELVLKQRDSVVQEVYDRIFK